MHAPAAQLPMKGLTRVLFYLKALAVATISVAFVAAEPPRPYYNGPPPQLSKQQLPPGYGAPPKQIYGPPSGPPSAPSAPEQEYGPPPASAYGPPAQQYGPPIPEKIITKNVYVHVPPAEPVEYAPSQQIEIPVPKKHYKIVFIKAPTPPTPTAPVIPEQPQDEHKTLVYVLVKKPEPQPEIEIPTPATTEPSKPEVYFIKYKEQKAEPHSQYGPPR